MAPILFGNNKFWFFNVKNTLVSNRSQGIARGPGTDPFGAAPFLPPPPTASKSNRYQHLGVDGQTLYGTLGHPRPHSTNEQVEDLTRWILIKKSQDNSWKMHGCKPLTTLLYKIRFSKLQLIISQHHLQQQQQQQHQQQNHQVEQKRRSFHEASFVKIFSVPFQKWSQ